MVYSAAGCSLIGWWRNFSTEGAVAGRVRSGSVDIASVLARSWQRTDNETGPKSLGMSEDKTNSNRETRFSLSKWRYVVAVPSWRITN